MTPDLASDPRRIRALNPPRYRGVLHSWCAPIALVAGLVAVIRADGLVPSLFTAIYMFTLVGMFTVSGTFHRRQWSDDGWWRMRQVDIAFIYLLIAGGFTGLAGIPLGGTLRLVVLCIVWGATLLALIYLALPGVPPFGLTTATFIAIGMCAVPVMPALADQVGGGGVWLIIAGGIVFILGAFALGARVPDPFPEIFGYHEIWHLLVAIGSVLHYLALVVYILPNV